MKKRSRYESSTLPFTFIRKLDKSIEIPKMLFVFGICFASKTIISACYSNDIKYISIANKFDTFFCSYYFMKFFAWKMYSLFDLVLLDKRNFPNNLMAGKMENWKRFAKFLMNNK